MNKRHQAERKILIDAPGNSIEPAPSGACIASKKPVSHHLAAAIPLKFFTTIDAHKLLASVLMEELVDFILRLDRQILSAKNMIILV